MVAVQVKFTAGRYHATPWGRHVNEGSAEWPPAPWRFLRALIAVFRAQCRHDEGALSGLLQRLASCPSYQLTPSTTGHHRHYVPVGSQSRLLLDTFVVCPSGITFVWPKATLTEGEGRLLDELLSELTYLGRTESWCQARRLSDGEGPAQAYPLNLTSSYRGPTVTMLCPEPNVTLQQLELSPVQMRRQRLNRPPGSQWVTYALEPPPQAAWSEPRPGYAVYVLDGDRPIDIRQTVKLADAVRRQLLRCHGNTNSPIFGGKVSGAPRADGHQHLHVLPEGKQTVEQVCLWAPGGFGPTELKVLRPTIAVPAQALLPNFRLLPWGLHHKAPQQQGSSWVSVTPYVPARRAKSQGRERSAEQIARECQLRGYPEPQVRSLGPAPPGWAVHRKGQTSSAGKPELFELLFPSPISGPLCLGANSHFGLGRFALKET